ncbi:MAG: SRPBCC family protein [Mycolicibacterium insubricum]|nr:SRPBCC family protein [Mycobacterium sp.]
MRYRDSPTVQESVVIAADPQRVWELVTDVTMPAKFSAELTAVEWIHGDTVAVGNRFRGHNSNPARGQWTTESLVVEVEEGRRWVWDVQGDGGQPMASWGFEVEPDRGGTLVRQWGRMGPGRSGLSEVIDQMPEKEARIIDRRLAGWREGMRANLRAIAEICAAESDSA